MGMSGDGQVLGDLTAGIAEIDAAFADYAEADGYYTGSAPEVFASARLRRLIARTGDRYRFALASTPVRALADRVALTGVTADSDEATAAIERIRDANLMSAIEADTHLTAFRFGDAYLFSWPTLDDSDQPTGMRVLLNSPETVRAIYDDDDPQRILYVIKSWVESTPTGKVRRADLYYDACTDSDGAEHRARIERYVTRAGGSTSGSTAAEWELYTEAGQSDAEWLIEHDYGMPWVHFRTGMPYGTPEHALAYGAQDAITKMLVTQLSTTESHGAPQRYGLADKAAVLDENTDDPDWGDDADADDTGSPSGGASSGLRDGPGTMQIHTGLTSVGQFDAADPKVFLDPVDVYVRIMSQLTGTPLWDFDPSREQPSGVSRRRAEAPLIAKVGNRLLYLTAQWRHFWARALDILGYQDATVTISWAPAYTVDDADGWQVLDLKRQMGVPLEQLLIEAGYTAEQAKQWAAAAHAAQQGGKQDGTGKAGPDTPVRASPAQADLDWGLFGATTKATATGGNA